MSKVDLSSDFCGVKFKNPVVIASATPSKNAEYMKKCVDSGAGGIIAKTVSPEPLLQKYVSPRFTVLQKDSWPKNYSNYSCEFLATYDVDSWMDEMKVAKEHCEKEDVKLVGSISGTDMDSWSDMAKKMQDTGVDMLELNFGCPHPRDLGYKSGQVLGSSPDAAKEVAKLVADSVDIPVIIKLTPDGVNPVDVAQKVKEAGADAVTAINRFTALEIDIDSGRPLLHGTYAGVNGPWMRPITLRWIAKIAQDVGIPISATNGIKTWKDMVKCIMVGASNVQTCTALMYGKKQFGHVQEFIEGIENFMVEKGYASIDEMKGITLPQIMKWDDVDRDSRSYAYVNKEDCIGCGMCPSWCFYDAITVDKDEESGKKKADVDQNKCDGCGLCVSLCPQNAMYMEGEAPVYLGDFE
ncbi:tRNA-dihydrouridine synthase [Natranaerofaba carboxydovora]|uniref:tRNA-dihydrouridine synthase n=1 Tax=Natranaerofaba carboxydovora TaxID=2742683 RepID=UPI001F141328|nr:tRNA-dihydrouridine synthase [Natranaerofaba carboxydovora]UMZ74792.1 NAD-dependent dihydropyrimidine dehydrogenase subunit PreA [Natranaerofaba carboxydovora]